VLCVNEPAAAAGGRLYDYFYNGTEEAWLNRQGNSSQAGSMSAVQLVANGTPSLNTAGCGTVSGASIKGGAWAGQFAAANTACGFSITQLFAAPNGLYCRANDITTTTATFVQTSSSTTVCGLSAASGVVVGDTIVWFAVAF
jgi:hypothetical protein